MGLALAVPASEDRLATRALDFIVAFQGEVLFENFLEPRVAGWKFLEVDAYRTRMNCISSTTPPSGVGMFEQFFIESMDAFITSQPHGLARVRKAPSFLAVRFEVATGQTLFTTLLCRV
jgi:hypothetical protein